MVNSAIKSTPIVFNSSTFGTKQSFTPFSLAPSLSQIPHTKKFNVILLSCTSLQDFQSKCTKLTNLLYDDTLIIIESSGYVKLEPFVQLSLPKYTNAIVVSIMNEADVRQLNNYEFNHTIRNNDQRIYLGSSSPTETAQAIRANKNFQEIYQFLDSWSSTKEINFLASLNPKEFTTYQWKLALPRLVFLPLSVVFEADFPEQLGSQILCKPLITGLVSEVFKIIKRMDCKLVKGFENEANLMKSWTSAYPATKQNQNYINSPSLLFNFINNFELEIDLLLLQPILLADDFNTKSPYLENVYSTLCQFMRINKNQSKLFMRKDGVSKTKLSQLDNIDEELSKKKAEHASWEQRLNDARQENMNLELKVSETRFLIKQMKEDISSKETVVSNLNAKIEELENTIQLKQRESLQLEEEYKNVLLSDRITAETPSMRDSFDKSSEESDRNPRRASNDRLSQDLQEKERELQRREKELNDRESAFRASNGKQAPAPAPPQQHYVDAREHYGPSNPHPNSRPQQHYMPQQYPSNPQYQQYQQYQSYQQFPPNTYYGSPMDQQPPHGLPQNGMPQNGLPPTLRTSHSMTGGTNRYQQPVNTMQQQSMRHRVPSNPSLQSFDNPMQHPSYNHPSFNNAAPIDPGIELRFRTKPKSLNRKSTLQMNGNLDGLDMGGRGGMPMPNSIKGRGNYPSPPMQQRKSATNMTDQFQHLSMTLQSQYNGQQHLAPPAMSGGSNTSGTSSTNTYDSVKTSNGYSHPHVPYDEDQMSSGDRRAQNKGYSGHN
jgi:ketopantoate reductase